MTDNLNLRAVLDSCIPSSDYKLVERITAKFSGDRLPLGDFTALASKLQAEKVEVVNASGEETVDGKIVSYSYPVAVEIRGKLDGRKLTLRLQPE